MSELTNDSVLAPHLAKVLLSGCALLNQRLIYRL